MSRQIARQGFLCLALGLLVLGFSAIVRDSGVADATVNYGDTYEFAGQRRSTLAP